MVHAGVRGADTRTGAGLACDRLRRAHADPGAHRLGEDPRRVPVRDRPADRGSGRGAAAALRLAAEGAELRRRAEPARAACRAPVRAERGRAHRRHAREGARGDAAQAAGHPDHHARVALPAAHLAGAGDAAQRRDADPRRGARGRGDEARRAPGAVGGAARPARPAARPACGPLRHPAPDRGDRPVRVRCPADPDRRRRHAEGARPARRRAGRGHARARRAERSPTRCSARAGRATRPRSGRRSTPSCCASSRSTARRSCSSTTGGWPSGWRCA